MKKSSWAVWFLRAPKSSLLSNPNLCVSLLPSLQVPEGRLRQPHTQEWPCAPPPTCIKQTHYSLDNRQLTCVTHHHQHMHACCHILLLLRHSLECFHWECLDVQEVLLWNEKVEVNEQVDSNSRQKKAIETQKIQKNSEWDQKKKKKKQQKMAGVLQHIKHSSYSL